MNSIKFTYVWDKLKEPEFTTIRSWTIPKEEYYQSSVGQDFQVWKCRETYPFNREYVLFHAYLADEQVIEPDKIPSGLILKDVKLNGVPDQKWIDKILKMDKAIVLTFCKYPLSHIFVQKRLEISE